MDPSSPIPLAVVVRGAVVFKFHITTRLVLIEFLGGLTTQRVLIEFLDGLSLIAL